MKPKFKVGDKVRILDGSNIENYHGKFIGRMRKEIGKTVTISEIETDMHDKTIGYRMVEVNFVWDERGLESAAKECIVIYRKDNETIALDKTTGKKAVAKCSPEDTYDFYTGAKLAFDRLTGTEKKGEEPKTDTGYLNCFVECVKNEYGRKLVVDGFTVGKIYEVKNGIITDDNGKACIYPKMSIDHLCKTMGNTFKEVKKVKRYAKAGEYVEVVAAYSVPVTDGKPDYKNGDIVKIIHVENTYGQVRFANGTDAYGRHKLLNANEYVVIEGYELPKPKYYNGKVVCAETSFPWLTKGKIYEIKDGILTYDNGKNSLHSPFVSFDEFEKTFRSEFIEIKE